MRKPDTTLSVLLPTYSDAQRLSSSIPELLDVLAGIGIRYELIVCDDGSPDAGETRSVAKRYGCSYVGNPAHLGKGAAIRRGMRLAKGHYRIFTDADLPFGTDSLAQLIEQLDTGVDMVVGDRTLRSSSALVRVPLRRRVGNVVCNMVVAAMFARGAGDTQCGLKGFRGDVAADLFDTGMIDGFAFDVELFVLAAIRGYSIQRIPVHLHHHSGSSVKLRHDGPRFAADLLRIKGNLLSGVYHR